MPSQSPSSSAHLELNRSRFLEQLKSNAFSSSKTLLAVSGGVDSMVMAHLYRECGQNFGIAHLNHGLRGIQADEDEAFSQQWAKDRNIPFHSKKIDLKALAVESGANIQALGRNQRYAFFEELMDSFGYQFVATAHHKDDDIENVIFYALRGNSIRGLSGIPAKRERIIRPLLSFSRTQILGYAQKSGISWREDPSNAELKYRRNEIRHSLLPAMEEFQPGIKEIIHQHSVTLRNSFAELIPFIQLFWDEHTFWKKECLWIEKKSLLNLQHPEIVVAEMLRPFGIESGLVPEFMRLMKARTGAVLRSASFEFINERQHVVARPTEEEKQEQIRISSLEELNNSPIPFKAEWASPIGLSFGKDHDLYLDAAELKWPLLLRHPMLGDRFRPLGMKGSVLISDFFTQQKLSRPEKEGAWLLISGNHIAAVLGFRIHNDYRIRAGTTNVLKIVRES